MKTNTQLGTSIPPSTRTHGQKVEQWVKDELLKKGVKFIKENFRTKLGEIDLIMQDKNTLVFIEVRYRKSTAYGDGGESVNFAKQQRIIRAAQIFLKVNTKLSNMPCRFDVVKVTGNLQNPKMTWIKQAFEVYY